MTFKLKHKKKISLIWNNNNTNKNGIISGWKILTKKNALFLACYFESGLLTKIAYIFFIITCFFLYLLSFRFHIIDTTNLYKSSKLTQQFLFLCFIAGKLWFTKLLQQIHIFERNAINVCIHWILNHFELNRRKCKYEMWNNNNNKNRTQC